MDGLADYQRGGERDGVFVKTVFEEITNFVQADVRNSVLLYPVLPKHQRFLTHKVVEENFEDLCSFSLGKGELRRTAVCLKSRLIFAFDSGYCLDEAVRKVAVRLCREKGLPVDFFSHSLWRPPPASKKMEAPASRPASKKMEAPAPRPARRQRRPDMQLYVPRGRKAEALKTAASADSLQKQMAASQPLPESHAAATTADTLGHHPNERAGIFKEDKSSEHGCAAEISTQLLQAADVCGRERGAKCTALYVDSSSDVLSTSANSKNSAAVVKVGLPLSQENDTVNNEEMMHENAEEVHSLPEPLGATAKCEGLQEKEDLSSLEDGAGVFDDSNVGISEQSECVTLEKPFSVLQLGATQLRSAKADTSGDCASLAETSTGDKSTDAEDSWDAFFDESGECIDPEVLKNITKALGNIKVHQAKLDYSKFETRITDLSEAEYGHILEIYNFPAEFKTKDLVTALSSSKDQFSIRWVDDTHALAIFSSPFAATEALGLQNPLMKLRHVSEASKQSKLKIKRCSELLMPYKPRPQTSASVARRLVSGALGMRVNVDAEQRKKERQVLLEAKGKRRTAAKQRVDAWNGDVS
ncbi:R3H and coiled-coil domain-containing protein 1-like [Amblyomma americanum]|uniref:R3H domain-containing protein n=1 Tax=Amblyomma americanum TaxID=6943 RepID=A0AAQ4E0X4_AMBAM